MVFRLHQILYIGPELPTLGGPLYTIYRTQLHAHQGPGGGDTLGTSQGCIGRGP